MKALLILGLSFLAISGLLAQQADFSDEYRADVLHQAQIMPRFPGCEGQNLGADELQMCSVRKLLSFIKEKQQYPETAKQKNQQGVVVLEVTVDTLGNLTHPEVIISRGEGLDQEALRILKLMPAWVPGEDYGRKVEVFFRIPFEFRLSK